MGSSAKQPEESRNGIASQSGADASTSSTTTTTVRTMRTTSSSTAATTDRALNIHVDTSPASSTRRDEQICRIVSEFCPFLVMSAAASSASTVPANTSSTRTAIATATRVDTTTKMNENENAPALKIQPLAGGLSNHLFIVSAARKVDTDVIDTPPRSVLVRIHPEGDVDEDDDNDDNVVNKNYNKSAKPSFSMVDRSVENRLALWLARQGVAPAVYGRFRNGRVEEFYSHVQPLSSRQMKEYAPQVARAMATFHTLQAPLDVLPKPSSSSTFNGGKTEEATSSLFVAVDEWLAAARDMLSASSTEGSTRQHHEHPKGETTCDQSTTSHGSNGSTSSSTSTSTSTSLLNPEVEENDSDNDDHDDGDNDDHDDDDDDDAKTSDSATHHAPLDFLDKLEHEWKWLSAQLAVPPHTDDPVEALAYDFIRQHVVAHMDCQPFNILMDQNDTNAVPPHEARLRLIDFEYAGWNARAADIANTFCEYCEMSSLKADYEVEYPTAEQQDEFFRHYCRAVLSAPRNAPIKTETLKRLEEIALSPNEHKSWSVFCACLAKEVGRFSLLSHLSWTVWSVIKAKEEDNVPDFDYMVYAKHRMDGYTWAKDRFFSHP